MRTRSKKAKTQHSPPKEPVVKTSDSQKKSKKALSSSVKNDSDEIVSKFLEAELTCCSCKSFEAPNSIKRYEEKPWIQCDLCRGWWHLECAFIDSTSAKKLAKNKIIFPCALCVLENSPWLIQDHNIKSIRTEDKTACQKSEEKEENFIKKQERAPQPDIIVIENNPTTPIFTPVPKALSSVVSLQLNTPDRSPVVDSKESPLKHNQEKGTIQGNEAVSDHKDQSKFLTVSPVKEASSENIIIIDSVKTPQNFQDSRVILKEIKKHKNITARYAYPLSRGGIAVHTFKEEDTQILKTDWPEEAFEGSGNSLVIHDKGFQTRCTLKNVPPYFSEKEVSEIIVNQTGVEVKCRRLRYRDTNKPLPIIIATCKSIKDLPILFKSVIHIRGKQIVIEAYRGKKNLPTRCYNCQAFGHIASMCTNKNRCEKCSEHHCDKSVCVNQTAKCVNCSGDHSSGSPRCPAFIVLKQRLESRQ